MMLVKTALWLRGQNGKHTNGNSKVATAESAADSARFRADSTTQIVNKLEQMRADIIDAHGQTRHELRDMVTVAVMKATEDIRYHIDMHMRNKS